MTYYVAEGDIVTLPNGTKVEVESVGHDEHGTFFTCQEDGEDVFYYTSILAEHPDNDDLED